MAKSLPTQPNAKATMELRAAAIAAAAAASKPDSQAQSSTLKEFSAPVESTQDRAGSSIQKLAEVTPALKMPEPIVYTDYRDNSTSATPGSEEKTAFGRLFK